MPVLKPIFGIFAVVGWLILMGLHVVWRATFGWLFRTLADFIQVDIAIRGAPDIHLFHGLANWLRSLDRNVDAGLVKAANNLEHVAVWLFSRVGFFFGWLASEIAGLAVAVEHKFLRLVKVTVPRLVHSLLKLVWRELRRYWRYTRGHFVKLARQAFSFAKWAKHKIVANYKHLGFLYKWARATLRAHWRAIRGAWRLLTRLEHRFVPKRLRGPVAAALKLLGFSWLFGNNVAGVGAWLVSRHPGAVWEFVKDTVTVVAETDMCKLAAYQYDLAVFVFEPVMQNVIGLTTWICHHSGHTLPSAVGDEGEYLLAWAPSATPPLTALKDTRRLAPGVPLPQGVIRA